MSCSSFWRIDDSGLESFQEQYGQNYAVRIAAICWLLEARPAKNTLCREKVVPSRAASGYMNWREEQRSRRRGDCDMEVRGERLSRSVIEQGVPGSSLAATSRRGSLFFGRLGSSWLSYPFFTVWYPDFKVYLSTVVTTIVPRTTL